MGPRSLSPLTPLLARLRADGFMTATLEVALDELHGKDPHALALQLLDAYLKDPPAFTEEGLDEVSDFAALLVLAAGKDAAQEACLQAYQKGKLSELALNAAARLLDHLGVEAEVELDAETRAFAEETARGLLAQIPAGPERLDALAAGLLLMPADMRSAIAPNLIDQLPAKERGTFAALALLLPLDDATRVELARRLAHGGSEGGEFLERLHLLELPPGLREQALRPIPAEQSRPVSAPQLSKLPLDWPVTAAYASVPDGRGSQAIYLVRKRSDGKAMLVGGVISPLRGVVDGIGIGRMSAAEEKDMLRDFSEGLSKVAPVPAEYALERLRRGVEIAAERGLPLPHSFQACRYLLSGLWGLAPVDVGAKIAGWAVPDRLEETDLLFGDSPTESFFYMDDGTHGTHDFFAEAVPLLARAPMHKARPRKVTSRDLDPELGEVLALPFAPRTLKALDGVIDRHVERIMTEPERRHWQDALTQLAYFYDRSGATGLRTLAATAAWALDPASGVPLKAQPFARELLRYSAMQADMQREQQAFEAGGVPSEFLAALAELPELAEALGGFAIPAPARAFQLKISLQGARPPIWRRVVVPADATLADLHEIIQVTMGWQDYHLHVFTHRGREYAAKGMVEGTSDEARVRLERLLAPGESLGYEYDFGDSWGHVIQVEKALAELPKEPLPRCVTGKRAAPPEDCGGLWGYYHLLEALANPDDPEHEDALELLGEDFDPEHFDASEANAMLRPKRPPSRKRR